MSLYLLNQGMFVHVDPGTGVGEVHGVSHDYEAHASIHSSVDALGFGRTFVPPPLHSL